MRTSLGNRCSRPPAIPQLGATGSMVRGKSSDAAHAVVSSAAAPCSFSSTAMALQIRAGPGHVLATELKRAK